MGYQQTSPGRQDNARHCLSLSVDAKPEDATPEDAKHEDANLRLHDSLS